MNDYTFLSGVCYDYSAATITLDNCQMGSGIYTANLRQTDSEQRGLSNTRNLSPALSLKTHLDGVLGEIAAFVALGDSFDYDFYPSVGEFGKPDFTYNGGKPGNIKCSPKYPNLLINEKHFSEDMLYIAAQIVGPNKIALRGWITGAEIAINPDWFGDTDGKSNRWLVKRQDLHPFRKFLGNPKK